MQTTASTHSRPLALITGASRRIGIGATIALELARNGWDVATTYWQPYDASMPWGANREDIDWLQNGCGELGARALAVEADLSQIETPATLFDKVEQSLGPVTTLILNHCQSVDSDIMSTSIESFDLHFAINTRANWLLIREFGKRFRVPAGSGRIIAITSDHTAWNLPYGASKGAMDRIVLAAARELAPPLKALQRILSLHPLSYVQIRFFLRRFMRLTNLCCAKASARIRSRRFAMI